MDRRVEYVVLDEMPQEGHSNTPVDSTPASRDKFQRHFPKLVQGMSNQQQINEINLTPVSIPVDSSLYASYASPTKSR